MSKKIFKTQEIKIAVLSIVGLFLIVWGINFLKGKNIFKKQFTYYAVFDNSFGLLPANIVVINGVQVGTVDNIGLLPENLDKVLVAFTVDKGIQIPSDSKIQIKTNLIGSSQLECVLGLASSYYKENDTLTGHLPPSMLDGIDVMKNNLDTIVFTLKNILVDGKEDVNTSLENISAITARLDSAIQRQQIEDIISEINHFTAMLSDNSSNIDNMIKNIDTFSNSLTEVDLPKITDSLSITINHLNVLLANMKGGEGTIGQLIVNDTLYQNLQSSLGSLNVLIQDIKENPKRYINVTVFGKKEKEKK